MNRTKSIFTGSLLGLGLLLAAGQPVQAIWDNTFTPSGWTRGTTPGSHYAEWNIFNDDVPGGNIQDTTPEVSLFGGGAYNLQETSGGSILTGGGNIYALGAPSAFTFTVGNLGGNPGDVRDVSLRIGSVGAFDSALGRSFTNFMLNGMAGTYQQLFSASAGPGMGTEVEALITWDDVPTASLFNLTWNAIGAHVSLDQLSIDIGPGVVAGVPLPAAAYLMASGLVGLAAMARRKQQAV